MSLSFNSDSVVGGPITTEVLTQLDKRQQILQKRNGRDRDDVLFLTSNVGWVKLTSSINFLDETEGKVESSDSQARANVLTGGTLKNGKLTGGIFNGKDTAYSKPGIHGFRPDAGITSFMVDTKSMFGALRVATVEFRVNSIEQLDTLESLFLRPGFSMLLEWGHSIYVKNNGDVWKKPKTYSDYFTPAKNSQEIIERIQTLKEESSYNYDGMFGIVKNFVWSYSLDGGYDCKVDLVSQGELIDSLSVIISPANLNNDQETEFDTSQPLPLQVPEESEQDVFTNFNAIPFNTLLEGELAKSRTPLHEFLNSINFAEGVEVENTFKNRTYTPELHRGVAIGYLNLYSRSLYQKFLKKLGSNQNDFRIIYWEYSKVEKEEDTLYSHHALIPLQHLLILVNEVFLLKSKDTPEESNGEFITKFFTGVKDENGRRKNITPFLTFDYHFALDPTKVILPKSRTDKTLTRLGYLPENNTQTQNLATDDILNIFISTDLILNTLDATIDSKDTSKQTVIVFMKSLLREINKQLGEINDLDIAYDESQNLHHIVDRKITPDDSNIEVLEVVGLKSQVENLSFSSKLSNNVTSMMAIAAQSQNSDIGIDSLAIQKWNTGLQDRHLINKFVGTETQQDKEKREERTIPFVKQEDIFRLLKYLDSVNNINSSERQNYYLQNNIESASGLATTHRAVMVGMLEYFSKQQKTNPAGLIPFELDLTLRGISGIKVGQSFRIQDKLIPERYQGNVGFICTGVSHKIESNRWLTDLKTQMCIIDKYDEPNIAEKVISLPAPAEARNSSLVTSNGEPEAGPTGLTFYSIFNTISMKTRLLDGRKVKSTGVRSSIGFYDSLRLNTDGSTRFHQAWDVVRAFLNGQELPLENKDIFMPIDGRVEWVPNGSTVSKLPAGAIRITGTGEYKGIRLVLLYLKNPTQDVLDGKELRRFTRIAQADSSAKLYGEQSSNPDSDDYQKDHIHIKLEYQSVTNGPLKRLDPRKEKWSPKPVPEIKEPELVNLDPFSNLPG